MRLGRLVISARAQYDRWHGWRGALAPSLLPPRHADPCLRSLGLDVARHVVGPYKWPMHLGLVSIGHECAAARGLVGHECATGWGARRSWVGGRAALYYGLVIGVVNASNHLRRANLGLGEESTRVTSVRFARPPFLAPPCLTPGSVPRGWSGSRRFQGRRFLPC
jgi:hypothetical protein